MYNSLYRNFVNPLYDNFCKIYISDNRLKQIEEFAKILIKAKLNESHHFIDNKFELKRFTTGLMGEAALEQFCRIEIIDFSIGNSKTYHQPDIPGYRIGIKTVEEYKFPIIFKRNYYSQIICIRSVSEKNLIYICGLAEPEILNRYPSDELIVDPNLRARGTKSGFYGFKHLIKINSLNDLINYKI